VICIFITPVGAPGYDVERESVAVLLNRDWEAGKPPEVKASTPLASYD